MQTYTHTHTSVIIEEDTAINMSRGRACEELEEMWKDLEGGKRGGNCVILF